MAENAPEPSRPAMLSRAQAARPGARRAVVIGAGSFGTAIAVLLSRAGVRAVLQTRSAEQATALTEARENTKYLPGVELPPALRIEPIENGIERTDYIFLAVPSTALGQLIPLLPTAAGRRRRVPALVSLSKGLVPPDGASPTTLLTRRVGSHRTACIDGPAHAQEMVQQGAALVAASLDSGLAASLAAIFTRAGVVCEISSDPIGVELAGVAKNAAALAAGATEAQGLNAAGAAAGHIFAEVWRYAEASGAVPESMIGLAGAGDLVATALAPQSRNRRAGELLARGLPAAEIERQVGQAVEALESVRLLAARLERAGYRAPVTVGLARLISGELPLDDWVALVRTTVPPPSRRRGPAWWRRLRSRAINGAPPASP
jgi:glycerol-3-phosphate dehydrogenase (NAD(P)+)